MSAVRNLRRRVFCRRMGGQMIDVTKEGTEKRFVDEPNLFNSILEEIGMSACLQDASALLLPLGRAQDPELLRVVAVAIKDERLKKLDLHRQWEKKFNELQTKFKELKGPLSPAEIPF